MVWLRVLCPSLILAMGWVFKNQTLELVDYLFGLGLVFYSVELFSTRAARLFLWCAAFLSLTVIGRLSLRHFSDIRATVVFASISAAAVFMTLFPVLGPRIATMAVTLCFFLILGNSLSAELWRCWFASTAPFGKILRGVFAFLVGIEFLLPRPYLIWLQVKGMSGDEIWIRIIPSTILAASLVALFFPISVLMPLNQKMFMAPQSQIVFGPRYSRWSRFDVSDIAFDRGRDRLFLCGDTQQNVKLYDARAHKWWETGLENDGNEFCEYDARRDELLTVHQKNHELLVMRVADLKVVASFKIENLPGGEVLLSVFPDDGVLVVASENEYREEIGPDIRVIDLEELKVLHEIDADVGFTLAHPSKPILYVNHFAMDAGIQAFDIMTGKRLGRSKSFGRSDRMIFDAKRNEVLATAPVTGQVIRFDADTLALKGRIKTVFGARGVGLDTKRDLLLVSSFLTNRLDVIDLETAQSLRKYWLGPWLRDVVVNAEQEIAYVASRFAMYRLEYLQ